jgi:hypothetical protein
MTDQSPFRRPPQPLVPAIPRGDVVATFDSYQVAQQAVDVLAKTEGFPVSGVSIIGSDLKSVERVTGTLTYGRAAVSGALTGAYFGVFFVILQLFFATETTASVIAPILIGVGGGMLFGVLSLAIRRRQRDFTSVMQVVATSYSIVVDPALSHRARGVLEREHPGSTQPPAV